MLRSTKECGRLSLSLSLSKKRLQNPSILCTQYQHYHHCNHYAMITTTSKSFHSKKTQQQQQQQQQSKLQFQLHSQQRWVSAVQNPNDNDNNDHDHDPIELLDNNYNNNNNNNTQSSSSSSSLTLSPKEQLFQSLEIQTSRNIQELITTIEEGERGGVTKNGFNKTDTANDTTTNKNNNNNNNNKKEMIEKRNRYLLSNRWKNAMKREAYQQRLLLEKLQNSNNDNINDNNNNSKGVSKSVEDLWDEVMMEFNIPPFDESSTFHNNNNNNDDNSLTLLSQQKIMGHLNDQSSSSSLSSSPIFGLQMDEYGNIIDKNPFPMDSDNAVSNTSIDSKQQQQQQQQQQNKDYDDELEEIHQFFANNNNNNTQNGSTTSRNNNYEKIIQKTIAILSTVKADEWKWIDSRIILSNDDDDDDNDNYYNEDGMIIETKTEKVDSNNNDHHNKNQKATTTTTNEQSNVDILKVLLEDINSFAAAAGESSLTTAETNLLLARLVTDTTLSVETILDASMQLYTEMVSLMDSGRVDSGPDISTYRILILALSGRLMAYGEAIKLSMEMLENNNYYYNITTTTTTTTTANSLELLESSSSVSSSSPITSAAVLNAMQACYLGRDIDAARSCMDFALAKNQLDDLFRPSLGSFMLLLDMLKKKNSQKEALRLFERSKESNALSPEGQNTFLLSLCQWPRRTRRGDTIDVAPFLMEIFKMLNKQLFLSLSSRDDDDDNDQQEQQQQQKKLPSFRVWLTLADQLASVAKSDESIWPHLNKVIKTILEAYPDSPIFVSNNDVVVRQDFLRIGVLTSNMTMDAKLCSKLIQKAVNGLQFSSPPPSSSSPFLLREGANDNDDNPESNPSQQLLQQQPGMTAELARATIPHQFFRNALETCFRCNDSQSARAILESFEQVEFAYPLAVQAGIQALAILCLSRTGEPDAAQKIVSTMVEKGMKPSESLFGAVLHSFAVAGRVEDAVALFEDIKSKPEFYGIVPDSSCYDAILLAYVRSHLWDDAISFQQIREQNGIELTPQAIQGLVLAYEKKGGKTAVVSMLERFVEENAVIDEGTLELLVNVLTPQFEGDIEVFRKKVRHFADTNPQCRDVSIELIRCIHTAKRRGDSKGNESKRGDNSRRKKEIDEAWHSVLAQFVRFVRASASPEQA